MTQSNGPIQISCPNCGQTYKIGADRWPQYVGKKTACKKCGQQFAVAAPASEEPAIAPEPVAEEPVYAAEAPASGSVPPPLPPMVPTAAYAPPMYGYPPQQKKGLGGGAIAAIILGVLAVLAIPCLIAILLPALNQVRNQAQIAKCASNLKSIAAACIQYSNANNGAYPDSINTLATKTGLNNLMLVCPGSNNVPGQCSYVYVGGSLNMSSPGNAVVAYEPLTNHHNRGINVLFADYSVQFLNARDAQALINSIVPGKPVVWPPPGN